MKRIVIAALAGFPVLLGLPGCARVQAPPKPGTIAVFDGGEIGIDEIRAQIPTARTPACLKARQAEGGGTAEALLPCYEELAADTALKGLILREVGDVDAAIAGMGPIYFQLRQHAYVEAFARSQAEKATLSDEEISAWFSDNREDFKRPFQATVWDIFKRYENEEQAEATLDFLKGLKSRCEKGESFASLARRYSDSETRLRDGLVGQVGEGRLPPKLDKIARALGEGEISDPIPVAGGAVLLSVTNLIEESQPELEAVRELVRRRMTDERLEEKIARRTSDFKPPKNAVLLRDEDLLTALDAEDLQRVVLDVSGIQVTAGQVRATAGLKKSDHVSDLDEENRRRLLDSYHRNADNQVLVLILLGSTAQEDVEIRARAEEHLRELGYDRLVDFKLDEEVNQLVDGRESDLRRFFADNRSRYQSEPAFSLRIWDLPFDQNPPAQLLAMEKLRAGLVSSELSMEAAAKQLGGEIRNIAWKDYSELDFLPAKAHAFLLQVPSGGYSVPFQQDDALHLIQVSGRHEPAPLDYEQVADRVRAAYLERFGQQLTREVIDRRLEAGDYRFFPEQLVPEKILSTHPQSQTP